MNIHSPKPKRLLPLLGLFITLIIIAGLGGIKETSAAEFPPLSTPPDAITLEGITSDIERDLMGAWAWHSGPIAWSSITNCLTGYPENGAGTYVSQWRDESGGHPIPGEAYTLSVVVAGIGNSCSGQYAYIDIGLPSNTEPYITPSTPIICYADIGSGAERFYPPDCPSTLVESVWYPWSGYPNVYQIEAPSGFWDIPQGVTWEFLIPVVSSSTMTGAVYQASVRVSDGHSNPELIPSVGVNVYSAPVPSAPTGVTASDGTYTNKVVVSWNSSSGATSYRVYRCTSTSTASCGSSLSSPTGTSYSDTGGTPGTTYYYRVKACNSSGCSGYSSYNTGYRATEDMPAVADFNGDGDTDFSFYRPSTGYWYYSDNGSPSWTWFGGTGTDIIVPGDYNGDGDTDFAYYRPSNGYWYVHDNGSPSYTWWGAEATDILVPGDYNGDGDTDFAYYRPSTGFWYVKDDGVSSWTWWGAAASDILVPGDYNGDGDTDFAYYRPSTGFWYVKDDGVPSWTWWGAAPTDVLVPGDFNGDGDTDLAYYRPSNGFWYVKDNGSPSWSWFGALPDDVIIPGDINGDGVPW